MAAVSRGLAFLVGGGCDSVVQELDRFSKSAVASSRGSLSCEAMTMPAMPAPMTTFPTNDDHEALPAFARIGLGRAGLRCFGSRRTRARARLGCDLRLASRRFFLRCFGFSLDAAGGSGGGVVTPRASALSCEELLGLLAVLPPGVNLMVRACGEASRAAVPVWSMIGGGASALAAFSGEPTRASASASEAGLPRRFFKPSMNLTMPPFGPGASGGGGMGLVPSGARASVGVGASASLCWETVALCEVCSQRRVNQPLRAGFSDFGSGARSSPRHAPMDCGRSSTLRASAASMARRKRGL